MKKPDRRRAMLSMAEQAKRVAEIGTKRVELGGGAYALLQSSMLGLELTLVAPSGERVTLSPASVHALRGALEYA